MFKVQILPINIFEVDLRSYSLFVKLSLSSCTKMYKNVFHTGFNDCLAIYNNTTTTTTVTTKISDLKVDIVRGHLILLA